MVLRLIMRYLANNERLIQMLADSYPIRKAARFTARLIIRAKYFREEALENMKKSSIYNETEGTKGSLLKIIETVKRNLQTFLKDSEGRSKKQ